MGASKGRNIHISKGEQHGNEGTAPQSHSALLRAGAVFHPCLCLMDTRAISAVRQAPHSSSVLPHFVTDRVGSVQTAADIESGKPIYINGKNFGTNDYWKVPKGQWSTTLILLLAGVIFIVPILGFMSVRTREETILCLQYLRL